ncbi:hypothetical protein BD779DRAFT_1525842 [Infundibulicybe gibba]|nr:hypothetical protein BD779DRAFT_1525842 [Infundibulicybe gibba]
MQAYTSGAPQLWDLSQVPSFSQLPDDDFLALLQKQFPPGGSLDAFAPNFVGSVNPQTISRHSVPSATPSSDDNSPSPSSVNHDSAGNDDVGDPVLKRKASDEDFEEGPSQKNQHTSGNGSKKTSSSARRKSTGTAPGKDENRLMKRKEQNRAAQRAFRERKEKHVKDLEDKVAALEAKNERAVSENENLRDLLSRLQSENVMLKQSSFTFSVPKTAGSAEKPISTAFSSETPFASSSRSTTQDSLPRSAPEPPKASNPLDWSSLTSFDPNMLNLLDDTPQLTATTGGMQMDLGYGNNTPYTTIASNPAFMSYTSFFDSATPFTNANDPNTFNFDMDTACSSSLDDLLAGYLGPPADGFNANTPSSSSISPVTHHAAYAGNANSNGISGQSSSSSSPSSIGSNIRPSPFAPPSTVRKSSDDALGSLVTCKGSKFPSTTKSDQNVEPAFRKECDINELCAEFTSKARCDGTNLVLEPQGVNHILETLSSKPPSKN